jgi:hypothetical protein
MTRFILLVLLLAAVSMTMLSLMFGAGRVESQKPKPPHYWSPTSGYVAAAKQPTPHHW